MYDVKRGLASTHERVMALVARARKGNENARAILIELVVDAGVFAICAANTPVKRQEQHFGAHMRGATIKAYANQKNSAANTRKWATEMPADDFYALFDDETGRTFAEAADAIPGLACVKAAYMAACLGFTGTPCFDRHMCRLIGVDEPKTWKEWDKVRELSDMTTEDQWIGYMGVPNYEGHTIWFDRVLNGVSQYRPYTKQDPKTGLDVIQED